jgi:hypothetical protein
MWRDGSGRRLALLVTAGALASLVLAVAGPAARKPGFFPRPLFGTPGKAAFCYADASGPENSTPSLLCWTPDDGFGVEIGWRGRRAFVSFHDHPPRFGEDFGDLRGYGPRARVLRYGQSWILGCRSPPDVATCKSYGAGVTTFRCRSRSTGLTCTNHAGHGWWLGRYRGYRLF